MLDAIMYIDVGEIEAPGVVGTVEDLCDVARDVEAERGRKVVCRANSSGQLAEGNVASVARDDSWGGMNGGERE